MKIGAGSIVTIMIFLTAILFVPSVSAGVDYDLTVNDKKGTVFKAKGAGTETVGGHDDIDITKVKSYLSGDEIILELTVVGNIQSDDAFDYDIRMDVKGDEDYDFIAEYENGSAELMTHDHDRIANINFTINGNTLKFNFSKELIGDHENFDISAQSAEVTDVGYYDLASWASWGSDDDDDGFLPGLGGVAVVFVLFIVMTLMKQSHRGREK